MSTPSLAETLAMIMDSRLAEVHTALPGIVVSYNQAKQTAVVQPAVKRLVATDDPGVFTQEKLPEIPDVAVCWPRGGDHYVHFALVPGDSVLLVFCALDPSVWQRTGELSSPADHREHSVAHAMCIPGLSPYTDSLPDVGVVTPKAAIGGSSDSVALASVVNAILNALKAGTPGSGYGASVISALSAYTTSASAVLKVGS